MIKREKLHTSLDSLYFNQIDFQNLLGERKIPRDDPEMLAHHLLGLVTEIGEVAQADKRWKRNKRNKHYDKIEKLSEIADCFIFLLNICIYSDITPYELYKAVDEKISKNKYRLFNPEKEETL